MTIRFLIDELKIGLMIDECGTEAETFFSKRYWYSLQFPIFFATPWSAIYSRFWVSVILYHHTNGFIHWKAENRWINRMSRECLWSECTFSWARIVSNSAGDRKSTRLNSSHVRISYAVFCLKKK